MTPVDFGTFDDPWQIPEGMTEAPMIHPTAAVKRSRMGAWKAALLRIAWWEWSKEKLATALQDFRALSADGFVAKYDPDA